MNDLSIARPDSKEAEPSSGTPSYETPSRIAAQRSASPARPVSTAIQPAITARGGYSSTASSPSALHHRCTVVIRPA